MSAPQAVTRTYPNGALITEVTVPGSDGPVTFTISVERDGDGDWIVALPWPEPGEDEEPRILGNGVECVNGIAYVAAEES